jgi:anti-anti-sigma regulatory factor
MSQAVESVPMPETMFSLSRVGHVAVVTLMCPSVRERQAAVLGRYLGDLCDQVQGRVILEVAGVGSFTCAWINELLAITRRCRAFGGNLVLIGLPERDERVLRSTGLLKHLTLARGRPEALNEFGDQPVAPWRLAVARLLDIPISIPQASKAA